MKPPAPSPAATVLLVRDREENGVDTGRVEVFMEKRHVASGFVGGAYVFPGGRVDADDAAAARFCARPPGSNVSADGKRSVDDPAEAESEAEKKLGAQGALGYYVAALRECFEEAGVLLAYDRHGKLLDFEDIEVEDHYRSARDEINAGTLRFNDLLERDGLTLATDRMHFWSHWITPVGEKRRYDTRFFIAEAPKNQTATHDDWELTSSEWVEPGTALDKAMAREWMIIFPTLHTLKRLEDLGSTDAALAWAAGDHDRPIYQPKLFEGKPVLPGDEGYDVAEEDVSGSDPRMWFTAFQR